MKRNYILYKDVKMHQLSNGMLRVVHRKTSKIEYKDFKTILSAKRWITQNKEVEHVTRNHYSHQLEYTTHRTIFY